MERVVDDLDDIEFTMKKARKVIADLTRGILTDKYTKANFALLEFYLVYPLDSYD